MRRIGEAAPVAMVGIAIIFGTAQVAHGAPTWAILLMLLGGAIIVLAVLNLLFGFLHRPLRWLWSHMVRIRIGLAPLASSKELSALGQERDALAKLADELRQYQMKLSDEIAALQPKAKWADSLIERERGSPLTFITMRCALGHERHLDDKEPYFDVDIRLEYTGVLRLVVGSEHSGKLSWEGQEFALAPQITHSQNQVLPFESDGPTVCYLKIRQYLTSSDRASEIRNYLERGVEELECWARDFSIALCKRNFAGEEVAAMESFVGDYLAAKVRQ